MSKEIHYMNLIKRNRSSCIFSLGELVSWIMEDEKILHSGAHGKAKRLIKKLPIEALSLTMYKLTVVPEGVHEPVAPKEVKKASIELAQIENPGDVINYLNERLGTRYKGKPADISRIKTRMSPPESFKLQDFKDVIDKKIADWKGTHFEKFLRPETLFGTKFESYLNEKNDIKQGKASEMAAYDFSKYLP